MYPQQKIHWLRVPQAPTHPPQFQERLVRIIGLENGAGLSRDYEVLAAVFSHAGWNVLFSSFNNQKDRRLVTLNIHLERVTSTFFPFAKVNVVIPNPEWWNSSSTSLLSRCSVWTKTADAERVFRCLGARNIEHIGFCSVDRLISNIARERSFLHIGGGSENKGTIGLIERWQPSWPTLTVVTTLSIPTSHAVNIKIINRKCSDDEIRNLQNSNIFHIYPSLYEGFGHAPWEGLSCGAITFVTDGPPFNEYPSSFRFMGTDVTTICGNVQKSYVSLEALASTVAKVGSFSGAELDEQQSRSRQAWELRKTIFHERIVSVIRKIENRQ